MENEHVRRRVACWGLCLAMLLAACRKDRPDPRWDVDVLAPLLITTFTLDDLVADSLLETAPDGALTLLQRSTLFGLRLDTVLKVPDTTLVYPYALPVPGPLNFPPGILLYSETETTQLDISEVQLRQLELRSGRLQVELKNMVATPVIATFSLPAATFQGSPVSLQSIVGAGTPSQPASATVVRDLAWHRFDLRGPQFDMVNALASQFQLQLDPAGQGATVTDQDSVVARATYSDLVPQYARGYFGSRTLQAGPEEIAIDVFSGIQSGVLDLDQVRATLTVRNGIGVDMRAIITDLRSIRSSTGQSISLLHPIVGGAININRATDLFGSFHPSTYTVQLDEGNSNIDLFVENLPDRLAFAADLVVNPMGDIASGNDFLYYDSELEAQLELAIPLRLIATDLTLQTVALPDLPGSADGHALRSGRLMLFATNGFPFAAQLLMDLVDANEQPLATIPVQGIIQSGLVGGDGLVHTRVASRLEATLSEEQVHHLYTGARVRLRTVFNTADQNMHLPLLRHYALDLQVTVAANYLVNGDR